jgi:membrane fusion protein, multidrug efflux system
VVKAGQVLFQMDQKPFVAQVDQAKAALQRNQAAADVAKSNLARTRPLAEQNALSQKDLNDAQGQCATDCGACPGADTSSSRSKWSTASSFRTLAGSRSPILLGAATSPARWRATGATF